MANQPRGPQHGTMLLRANNGTEHIARWKFGAFGLDIPALRIGDQTVVWLWSGIPFAIIFFGIIEGIVLISAILSLIGVTINIKIFRANISPSLQFLLSIIFTLLVCLIFGRFVGQFIPE
jgi:hypothetical protein